MKIFVSFLFALLFFTFAASGSYAQNNELTIILLRHAEKDISPGADKVDPNLSAEGKQRAERFLETVRKYKPDYIYSTNFKRTIFTVTPLAENLNERYRLQIQKYDHSELEAFAAQLMKLDGRTIVVAGHNTTTPMLANLLVKQPNKYGALKETEYNKIWIIKIKKNKITDTVIEY
jgi:2,3-bisphosphoglycerate-dependent phosphoglycerate mutase